MRTLFARFRLACRLVWYSLRGEAALIIGNDIMQRDSAYFGITTKPEGKQWIVTDNTIRWPS